MPCTDLSSQTVYKPELPSDLHKHHGGLETRQQENKTTRQQDNKTPSPKKRTNTYDVAERRHGKPFSGVYREKRRVQSDVPGGFVVAIVGDLRQMVRRDELRRARASGFQL